MTKVVTLGEIMLRLSPPGHERLFQSPQLAATFGGGEANVAVSLAHFGLASTYLTRLPEGAVGEGALRALRAEGVCTDFVLRGGERLGIYFAEKGAGQRPSTVVYDRAGSAVSQLEAAEVDWPGLFEGAAWLHCTGITPALGPRPLALTRTALKRAREVGATVSFDLNYRRKLWSPGEAQEALRPLMSLVDVVIANEEDLQHCLGVEVARTDVTAGRLDLEAYREAAAEVSRRFGPPRVAVTLRQSLSASVNGWSAVLYDAATERFFTGPCYEVRLVDRIGGGDAFAAGLIYALLEGRDAARALAFAVAAGALKQTIPGDFNRVSVAEVERLAAGDASGRVRR